VALAVAFFLPIAPAPARRSTSRTRLVRRARRQSRSRARRARGARPARLAARGRRRRRVFAMKPNSGALLAAGRGVASVVP
jgi:hypothetical protein